TFDFTFWDQQDAQQAKIEKLRQLYARREELKKQIEDLKKLSTSSENLHQIQTRNIRIQTIQARAKTIKSLTSEEISQSRIINPMNRNYKDYPILLDKL